MGRYQEVFRRSLQEPEAFWGEAARALRWRKPWERVLDRKDPKRPNWFQGGELNTCENALDVHVESGRADQLALVWDSAVANQTLKYTYRELLQETARFAGALRRLGVGKGDRVVIYMPMVPQAVIAMLACARLGAVHSVVFGGFAAHELAARIEHARPKAIVCGSCGLEPGRTVPYKPMVDKAISISKHKPEKVIVLQRPQLEVELQKGRDVEWNDAVAGVEPAACVSVSATDPLYVLYTSGTTGRPKGIVRDNGGHAVALKYSMGAIYNARPGEPYWAASDIGWVVGHSYIVYAPLLNGNTTILYEGKPVGTPDAGAFWRVVSQHGVQTLFTAPTAFRAIRREDPEGKFIQKHHPTQSLRALYLAGERCDPETLQWAQQKLRIPVVDHWWQTETGWPIVANPIGIEAFPVKPGSATKPVPGYDVRVLDETGNDAARGQNGAIAIRLPLPPGCLPTLYDDDATFESAYLARYPGYYLTGDGGFYDQDGYLSIMGRIDDVINVAGHRLSTGAMEEILASHKDVAECAVVGVNDQLKGEVPVGFVVLKSGVQRVEKELVDELCNLVRERIGPVAFFKQAAIVPKLPKTRSGKILRGTIRKIADGIEFAMPATIEDPASLEEMSRVLSHLGYPRKA
ncbi:MAG: propionyl-CoA synthetase [Deltaproteobacteria bacterium]|nr:MAG: propionyl-CoA synthetase [Deltaproteobacteria bacterium]